MAIDIIDDDNDELLQWSEDDSISEAEDQCLPLDKAEEASVRNTVLYISHTKLEFILTKVLLILSTTLILILLPLYMESNNIKSDVYTMVFFNNTASVLFLLIIIFVLKTFCSKMKNINVSSLPMKCYQLIQLAIIYVISTFMVVYALDRKRVVCHLQDPVKGVVMVFSLLYYFFFCKKLMGLQRIFSATTIIVGLFISVDYGLCDEFRCRGYEREQPSDDTGHWDWQTHSIWTTVYIIGLALFAAYFTILERHLLNNNPTEQQSINVSSPFLITVSRSVSYSNSNNLNNCFLTRGKPGEVHVGKKYSVLHIALWIHIFVWFGTIIAFWTAIMPNVGKASATSEFFNYTINGIWCHFKLPVEQKAATVDCGNTILYSWPFIWSYILFTTTAIKFLILSQSAVYTIATMTTALPLVGIWWSLFHMIPIHDGLLIWSPSITGELICSLLGLQIILIGLFLLLKSHFNDYQWSQLALTHIVSSNNLN